MSKQYLRFSILLLLLICIHSICPLLCASTGKKFCNLTDAFAETRQNDTSASCCDRTESDDTEIPSDQSTTCCSNDMTFVIPNDSHSVDNMGIAAGQYFGSIVQSTLFLTIHNEKSLSQQSITPTRTHPSFHNAISRRGPPFTRS